jgi:hypothetical protein
LILGNYKNKDTISIAHYYPVENDRTGSFFGFDEL